MVRSSSVCAFCRAFSILCTLSLHAANWRVYDCNPTYKVFHMSRTHTPLIFTGSRRDMISRSSPRPFPPNRLFLLLLDKSENNETGIHLYSPSCSITTKNSFSECFPNMMQQFVKIIRFNMYNDRQFFFFFPQVIYY